MAALTRPSLTILHYRRTSRLPYFSLNPQLICPTSIPQNNIVVVMLKKRTQVFVFMAFLLILNAPSILHSQSNAFSRLLSSEWPALQASMTVGAVLGLVSMFAALAVAVPAVTVAWITVVVVLAFLGKSTGDLLVEGRKIQKELAWFVGKVLLKESNVVAIACAVLGVLCCLQEVKLMDRF